MLRNGQNTEFDSFVTLCGAFEVSDDSMDSCMQRQDRLRHALAAMTPRSRCQIMRHILLHWKPFDAESVRLAFGKEYENGIFLGDDYTFLNMVSGYEPMLIGAALRGLRHWSDENEIFYNSLEILRRLGRTINRWRSKIISSFSEDNFDQLAFLLGFILLPDNTAEIAILKEFSNSSDGVLSTKAHNAICRIEGSLRGGRSLELALGGW